VARQRTYTRLTAKQYARAIGKSERQTRRLLKQHHIPGAHKVFTKWFIPVTVRDAARGFGVSESTVLARIKQGIIPGMVGESPEDLEIQARLIPSFDEIGGRYIPPSFHTAYGEYNPYPYLYRTRLLIRDVDGNLRWTTAPPVGSFQPLPKTTIRERIEFDLFVNQKGDTGSPGKLPAQTIERIDFLKAEVRAEELRAA
jgi:hypothetical protein